MRDTVRVTTAWQPVNEIERTLARALAAGDLRAYFQAVTGADLYLPLQAGDPPQALSLPAKGRRYLVVFTSLEALRAGAGSSADEWVGLTYDSLSAHWLTSGWGLAVDPHLDIGALLDPPDFVPANEAEAAMADALRTGDRGRYYDALVGMPVVVPVDETGRWAPVPDAEGTPGIVAFTSTALLVAVLPPDVAYGETDLLGLLRSWPDARYPLRVNPGSPIAMDLTPDEVEELIAVLERG